MSEEISPDITLCQSYIFSEDKAWFVSTIDRPSSAMCGPRRFSETIVWNWDKATRERGALVHTDGCSSMSIVTHQKVVQLLFMRGIEALTSEE